MSSPVSDLGKLLEQVRIDVSQVDETVQALKRRMASRHDLGLMQDDLLRMQAICDEMLDIYRALHIYIQAIETELDRKSRNPGW